ncbi:hypothetical protein BKA69DRAFT_555189 [Paraphysoderma sedebokerense]|nr:hypothetical protein BKA69DRAFT_555189 [Paraphysoderma sedebokerense]
MEVLDDDFVGLLPYTKVGRPAEFVQSSNILVRLRSKSPENEFALLISAHYDSVATGFGVGDNGIGVVVAIEVVHALLYYENIRFDVILNIGNGEEYGYFSSRAFTAHSWFKDVKAFINLDAVSAKGKVGDSLNSGFVDFGFCK